jgi:hypothetical protein
LKARNRNKVPGFCVSPLRDAPLPCSKLPQSASIAFCDDAASTDGP